MNSSINKENENENELCCICLECTTQLNKPYFNCNHVLFHKECILNLDRCPLCRVGVITNENDKRILIWFESQRQSAILYKNVRNLNYPIVLITSKIIKRDNDIVYNNR